MTVGFIIICMTRRMAIKGLAFIGLGQTVATGSLFAEVRDGIIV
jgi:hypothetical protein